MPKPFADYGLTAYEFDGLVLEDPALFDSFLVRLIEDVDLCQQLTAGYDRKFEIPEPILDRVLESIGYLNAAAERPDTLSLSSAPGGSKAPDTLISAMEPFVRAYIRGPAYYTDSSLARVTNVVATVAYDALSTGGRRAREDGTEIVKLRHWLPACEDWPYPFNRYC